MTTSRIAIPALLLFLMTAGGALTQGAIAQQKGFGLGVILGEPTGFSFKGWTGASTAIDGALAWSFVDETTFHVHVDWLWHNDAITKKPEMPVYYGVGGRIKTGGHGDDRIGFRVVGGLGYYIPDTPIDVFVEIAPILDIAPGTDFSINGGIGARYFFR
jgi:hypothetical protein